MATQKIPGRAIKLGTDTEGDVTYFDGLSWVRLPIGDVGDLIDTRSITPFQWGMDGSAGCQV